MADIKLFNGDCLKVMDELIESGVKVDAIITDPPYGTTENKWDSVIPLDLMWDKLYKLVKENGATLLFSSQPFTTILNYSNIKNYRYEWVWIKNNTTGFQLANKRPLKKHEIVSVFYQKQPTYNPQGLIKCNHVNKRGSSGDNWTEMKSDEYISEFTNYPSQILNFPYDTERFHPTQKTVSLLEYLIKTYTQRNETILDFTMGSGSTGVACVNTNRNFIGIELDENYFKIAEDRINKAIQDKKEWLFDEL